MMSDNEILFSILDSASEDAYGSWELWWGVSQRTEKGSAEREVIRKHFVDIVERLVFDKKLITLRHKHKDNSYTEIAFERSRLEDETRMAETEIASTDIFYWFETTEAGTVDYNQMVINKLQREARNQPTPGAPGRSADNRIIS